MRQVEYHVDVLRSGVPYGELAFVSGSPPTVYASAADAVKMSLRGTFSARGDVDYLTDELRPRMIVDGVSRNLGVYRVATRTRTMTATGGSDVIEAYDRGLLLSWCKLEQRDFWPAGTTYQSIVEHYLAAAGIVNALVIPTAAVLQSDREDWDIGTSYLEIINTLLSEINYNGVWFDLDGFARVEPYTEPSAANIAHTYGKNGVTLVSDAYQTEADIFNKPNVFICILENPEYDEPLVARAENNVPGSRLSIFSRGLRIPQVTVVQNIADAAALQAYADRLCFESMQESEYVDITTAGMPDHNIGDTVALQLGELAGIYRETEWQLSMTTGAVMRHKLQRLVLT